MLLTSKDIKSYWTGYIKGGRNIKHKVQKHFIFQYQTKFHRHLTLSLVE